MQSLRTLDRRTFLQSTLTLTAGTLLPRALWADRTSHRASVTEFGADPTGERDSTQAVQAAIASLDREQSRLVFPAGKYRFAASRETVMQFSGFQGIEVYANNAELLFAGDSIPFGFRASKDVAVHDLKVDWDRPAFSQGVVREAGAQSFTIDIDDAFPVTGAESVTGYAEFDATNNRPAASALLVRGAAISVSLVQAQRLRIGSPAAAAVRPGMRLVLLHGTAASSCFLIESCENILLEGVTVRQAPAMAFHVRGCRDVRLDNITVEPASTSATPALLATGSDGLHCSNSHGKIVLKEVRFSGIGGDAVNIYQPYWRIVERPDDRTIVIAGADAKPLQPWELPETGDFIQFSSSSNLKLLGEIGVSSLEAHPKGARLELAETLSPVIIPGTLVCGVVYAPRITVDEATVKNTLGKGMLLHTRAEVANSSFQGCWGEAIALAPDLQTMQGPTGQHVSIRASTFDDCAIGLGKAGTPGHQGMITIDNSRLQSSNGGAQAEAAGARTVPRGINSGVRIQGNTFFHTNRTAIFADGVEDLVIEENILGHMPAPQKTRTPSAGVTAHQPPAIVLRNVANAEVSNNTSDVPQTIALTDCADSVKTENNRLLTAARLG